MALLMNGNAIMSLPTPIEKLSQNLDDRRTYSSSTSPNKYPVGDDDNNMEEITMSTANKSEVLARRTSQILSNYRSFLEDYQAEDGKGLETDTSISSSNRAACLMRDFTMSEVPLGDIHPEENRHYKMAIGRKAKYGIYTSIGLCLALIVGLLGSSAHRQANTSKNSNVAINVALGKNDTPQWHSEAAYLLQHEDGNDKRLQHFGSVPLGKEDVASTEVEIDTEAKETQPDTVPLVSFSIGQQHHTEVPADVTSSGLSKELHDKHKPLWLSAKEGWLGGSHEDAMTYCNSIRGKELCPYSVMCPFGQGHKVLSGRKQVDFTNEGEHYAPVFGHDNRWVMIGQKDGDPSTTCMSYEMIYKTLEKPEWGLTSKRPELKSHIMCCTMNDEQPSL